ncbi:MAG: ABC transporter permease [Nitrospinota bacterium]
MDFLWEGLKLAFWLVVRLDPEVFSTAALSLRLSLTATLAAALVGVPAGYFLTFHPFRGRGFVVGVVQSLMGLPTVVVGLTFYALLSREGPMGGLGLLFTPGAVVIGLVVLSLPIVCSLSLAAIQAVDPRVRPTALTLGASRLRVGWTVCLEARFALAAALVAAFGRVVAEIGIALMLGGNIRGYTRTLTTAIALETTRGELGFAVALGIVLMFLVLVANLLFRALQRS